MELTIEKIRGSVSYDPVTGIFTWTRDILSGKNNAFVNGRKGEKAGFIAGNHADGYGYEYISIDGRRYSSHRLAWFYMTGSFPSKSYDIDHINGIRSDNRWSNLRLVSRSINMQNLKKGS